MLNQIYKYFSIVGIFIIVTSIVIVNVYKQEMSGEIKEIQNQQETFGYCDTNKQQCYSSGIYNVLPQIEKQEGER